MRCEGCGVMQHPGCWVTNGGCATQGEHKVTPIAQAYSTGRAVGEPAPHPGEGTRTREAPGGEHAAEPIPSQTRPQPPPLAIEQWPVIGGAPVPARVQRQHPAEGFTPPPAPRRYVPPEGDPHAARKPLPKIYDRHGILEYWYVPAALLVVGLVAFGVIWGVGRLTGDDSSAPSAAGITPGPTVQLGGAASPSTAAITPNPASATTPVPSGTGKFKQGDTVVVTGAGDCLNVRTAPGRTNEKGEVNPSIVCLNDGLEVKVLTGPQIAGDLTWWKVATTLGDGWAAEDYLVRKP